MAANRGTASHRSPPLAGTAWFERMARPNATANIAPRPQWSFAEVVEHAWQTYTGFGRESGGRRNVLLRVWAAMVGDQRAIAELDQYVSSHRGYAKAAETMGCGVSTLRSLRNNSGWWIRIRFRQFHFPFRKGNNCREPLRSMRWKNLSAVAGWLSCIASIP